MKWRGAHVSQTGKPASEGVLPMIQAHYVRVMTPRLRYALVSVESLNKRRFQLLRRSSHKDDDSGWKVSQVGKGGLPPLRFISRNIELQVACFSRGPEASLTPELTGRAN